MANELDPVIGQWYRHLDKGQEFTVSNVDEDNEVVEIQHYDGDIEEYTFEEWQELEIEVTEPPEDWSGPMDDVEFDDMNYDETEMSESDWEEPLDEYGSDER